MRKIVMALMLILSYGVALAGAPPAPTIPPASNKDDANVTVDVITPLSIEIVCPYCKSDLPWVIVGTSINVPNHMIAFLIKGEPGFAIDVTTDGLADGYGNTDYQPNSPAVGTTMTGRWGSFSSGTKIIGDDPGEWGALPTTLSSTSTSTLPAGRAYCNFIVDKLTAASNATIGYIEFTINVYAIYDSL